MPKRSEPPTDSSPELDPAADADALVGDDGEGRDGGDGGDGEEEYERIEEDGESELGDEEDYGEPEAEDAHGARGLADSKNAQDTKEKAEPDDIGEDQKPSFSSHGLFGSNGLRVHESETEMEKTSNGDSMNHNGTGASQKKDEMPSYTNVGSQILLDVNNSSVTPQCRPRSSSPSTSFENQNKKPAMICDFFARGWCIKGNLCQFIHKKEELITNRLSRKEVEGVPVKNEDPVDHAGSAQYAEQSKPSTLHEHAYLSKPVGSTHSELQRTLIRTYGRENHGQPHVVDDHNVHASEIAAEELLGFDNSRSRLSTLPLNELGQMQMVHEEHRNHIGVVPLMGSIEDRYLASQISLSRRYLNEGKLCSELGKGDTLNDALLSRASWPRAPLVPEYRHPNLGSTTVTGMDQNRSNYANDRRLEHLGNESLQKQYSLHDSYRSYGLTSSGFSNFGNSVHSLRSFPSLETSGPLGTSSALRLTVPSFEHNDLHKTLDYNRGYYGSKSASLSRSSPLCSKSDVESITHQSFTASAQTEIIQDSRWELSVPFRSSFCSFPMSKSTSRSQYDPLVDSIDPSSVELLGSQHSPKAMSRDMPDQHINRDPLLLGSQTAACSTQKSTEVSAHPLGLVDGYALTANDAKHDTTAVVTGSKVNGKDPGNDEADNGRNEKEPKVVKIFRSALIDFVKELLKPSWRDGHLSKDAHKMVVKKAVEKVLGALQLNQVPSTTELINHYLSTSRPKLLKLVEGYVHKYGKS